MSFQLATALLSGLIAAISSGIIQILISRFEARSTQQRLYNERKVEEYFNAMDSLSSLREELLILGMSMSGRRDPKECDSPEEKQEMIDRDEKGAAAVEAVSKSLSQSKLAAMRLNLMGSERALADFKVIENLINRYGEQVIEDVSTDGLFKANKFSRLVTEFDEAFEQLITNAKVDLMIGASGHWK